MPEFGNPLQGVGNFFDAVGTTAHNAVTFPFESHPYPQNDTSAPYIDRETGVTYWPGSQGYPQNGGTWLGTYATPGGSSDGYGSPDNFHPAEYPFHFDE